MKTHLTIELPLHYRVVAAKRVTPFHWALLKALQSFPTGARPDLGELSRRLCLGEVLFLEKAWNDLRTLGACDDSDFTQARLSIEGEDALKSGFFHLSPVEERTQTLCFDAATGKLQACAKAKAKNTSPLTSAPAWATQLNPERLTEALLSQPGALKAGERLLSLHPLWPKALQAQATAH